MKTVIKMKQLSISVPGFITVVFVNNSLTKSLCIHSTNYNSGKSGRKKIVMIPPLNVVSSEVFSLLSLGLFYSLSDVVSRNI